MQKLRPREVDVLAYPNGAHMTFGASSPRVRFLDVYDLRVSRQCHLPYNIKPFTDEVLCDVAPLDVSDVLLGQPYLWK
jgi:hypothetical protein